MSDVGRCCVRCGKGFQQLPGRGRPRAKCLDCSPRKRPLSRPRPKTCNGCGATFATIQVDRRYCTVQCGWRAHSLERGPKCCGCGKQMHHGPSSLPEGEAKCLECRRRLAAAARARDSVHAWTCEGCGAACTRPATKGQRPKWCDTCRRIRANNWVRVTPTVRMAIYERDGWTCWLCEERVSRDLIGTRDHWRPALDHVVPKAHGGSDDPSNLKLAHWWCNSARSDGRTYTEEDFRVAS